MVYKWFSDSVKKTEVIRYDTNSWLNMTSVLHVYRETETRQTKLTF